MILSTGNDSSLTVEIDVEGKPISFLVDTGAASTIIDLSLFESLFEKNFALLEYDQTFWACGNLIDACGRVKLNFSLGEVRVPQWVTIVDLGSPMALLGLDFMRQNEVKLNLGTRVMTLHEEEIPLSSKLEFPRVCQLIVDKEVVIGGRSECLVFTCFKDKLDREVGNLAQVAVSCEFSYKFAERGVYVVPGVVDPLNRKIPVMIINCSNEDLVLSAGFGVASLVPCDSLYPMYDVRISNSERDSQEVLDKLPDCLEGLLTGDEILDMSDKQRSRARAVLLEFADVFSKPGDALGRTSLVQHHIRTKSDKPVKLRPYRMDWNKRRVAEQEIQSMLQQGVIQPSDSEYCSPVVLVRKKDGTWRFCVDYRKLNEITEGDSYQLPLIEDILDSLGGSRFFSTADLKSGYWQIEMYPEDKKKTAFGIPGLGLYEFCVMPFGLKGAPACFQRLMEKVLRDVIWKKCLVFLDDILIFGSTFEASLSNLRQVLSCLKRTGLRLKPQKCKFFRKRVEFLGHVISAEGVSCAQDKIACVRDWPAPCNLKDLRAFLGLCNYYRKFVSNFATIAAPLVQLTRKSVPFVWTNKRQVTFDTLKGRLTNPPVLTVPDENGGEFILDSDCSNAAAGAVLSQIQSGKEKVVAYASTTLNKAQCRYCATYKELYAVQWAVNYFAHYLTGRKFRLRTDHSALRWLMNFKKPEGMVARWIIKLSEYDFVIEHRAGEKHLNADALSRIGSTRCRREDCFSCNGLIPGKDMAKLATIQDMKQNDEPWLKTYTKEQLVEMQQQDADIATVLHWKKRRDFPPPYDELLFHSNTIRILCGHWKLLAVIDDILYKEYHPANSSKRVTYQYVVPEYLRVEIFHHLHNLRTAGHMGVIRTYKRIRERFYWPGMKKYVQLSITKCKNCAQVKTRYGRHQGKLKKMLTASPMTRIALDIVGPLVQTELGNQHILVVTDFFTKWAEAYPVKDQCAATIADVIVTEFFSRFGTPEIILSDQGSNFQSELFKNMCGLYGIKQTKTSPYHPQCDGQTERQNRTLITMLKAFVSDKGTDWDNHIPYVMTAYRSSVHESTGYSPNYLMLGRETKLPIDIMYGEPPGNSHVDCYHEYVEWFKGASRAAFEFARLQLAKTAERQIRNYDKNVCEQFFKVGDHVWFYYPPMKKKLSSGWVGPYIVVKCISELVYRIRNLKSGEFRIAHVDKLRLYVVDDCSPTIDDDAVNLNELFSETSEPTEKERDPVSPVTSPKNCNDDLRTRRRRRPVYLDDYVLK